MQRCADTQLHWNLFVCETLAREPVVGICVRAFTLCLYKEATGEGSQTSCKRPDGKWRVLQGMNTLSLLLDSVITAWKPPPGAAYKWLRVMCSNKTLHKPVLTRIWPMSHNLPTTRLDYKQLIWGGMSYWTSSPPFQEREGGKLQNLSPIGSSVTPEETLDYQYYNSLVFSSNIPALYSCY